MFHMKQLLTYDPNGHDDGERINFMGTHPNIINGVSGVVHDSFIITSPRAVLVRHIAIDGLVYGVIDPPAVLQIPRSHSWVI